MNSTPILNGIDAWKIMYRGGIVAVYLPFIDQTTGVKYRMNRDLHGRHVYLTNVVCGDMETYRPCKADFSFFTFTDSVFVEVNE